MELPLNPLADFLNITQEDIKNSIFISGHVPSKKNGKFAINGRVIMNKSVSQYIKATEWHYKTNRQKFLELINNKTKHILLCMYFIRKDNRRFDYVNISQIVLDLLVKYNWIDDDNANTVIPVFLGHTVCKGSEGVFILAK